MGSIHPRVGIRRERKGKSLGKLTFICQRVCDGPEEREERERLEPGD